MICPGLVLVLNPRWLSPESSGEIVAGIRRPPSGHAAPATGAIIAADGNLHPTEQGQKKRQIDVFELEGTAISHEYNRRIRNDPHFIPARTSVPDPYDLAISRMQWTNTILYHRTMMLATLDEEPTTGTRLHPLFHHLNNMPAFLKSESFLKCNDGVRPCNCIP